MPKKIKVLSRTLLYGDQLLGKGGEYTVSDAFAKEQVVRGKVEIIENLGSDATPLAENKKIDHEFMDKVKHHAPEIMGILEMEFERQRQARIAEREYEEKLTHLAPPAGESTELPKTTDEAQPAAVSTEIGAEVGKTEEISTSSEKVVPIDELGGTQATEGNSIIEQTTSISEDFPGFQSLKKHGVTTMERLSELGYDELIELGIRQGTANQIGAKLMELKESNA